MNDTNDAPAAERRSTIRHRFNLPISVRARGLHKLPARLCELSNGGCRVDGVRFPHGTETVWVHIPGLASQASALCWTADDQIGLVFEQPLHPAVTGRLAEQHSPALTGDETQDHVACAPAAETVAAAFDKPAGSRREQIIAGYVMPAPGLLLDKKPLAGGNILGGLVRRNARRVTDHRREARFPAPAEATAGFAVEGRQIAIDNISHSGVMAVGELAEGIGDQLEVRFAGYPPITASVVWKRGDRIGLALPSGAIDLSEPA